MPLAVLGSNDGLHCEELTGYGYLLTGYSRKKDVWCVNIEFESKVDLESPLRSVASFGMRVRWILIFSTWFTFLGVGLGELPYARIRARNRHPQVLFLLLRW